MPGSRGCGSLGNILAGEVNPSGHLADIYAYDLTTAPSYYNFGDYTYSNFDGNNKYVYYQEGIYVGYRYYDKIQLPVRWCFGYGLSYTTFAYSNLKIQEPEPSEQIRQLQKNNQIEKIKRLQKDIGKQTKDLKERIMSFPVILQIPGRFRVRKSCSYMYLQKLLKFTARCGN